MRAESVIRRRPHGAKRGKARLFEFAPGLDTYLAEQAKAENKTMVQFLEELILFRKRFKSLPQTNGK